MWPLLQMKLGGSFRFNLYCLASEIYGFRHKIAVHVKDHGNPRQTLKFSNSQLPWIPWFRDFDIVLVTSHQCVISDVTWRMSFDAGRRRAGTRLSTSRWPEVAQPSAAAAEMEMVRRRAVNVTSSRRDLTVSAFSFYTQTTVPAIFWSSKVQ